MSDTSTPCARGCIRARRHLSDCDDRECRGCQPREAEFGRLCFGCHQRLLNMLHTAPAQHALLLAVVEPSSSQALTAETRVHYPQPRTDSSGPLYMQPAHRGMSAEGSEPVRVAALDTAQALDDVLSQWVEMVAADHALSGPVQLVTGAQAEHGKHGRWRRMDDGEPVWTEPPARYEIGTASRWLVAQVGNLEASEGIEYLWTELAEIMSQAHALAPWRQQATRLPAIECPCCHRPALTLFGGDEDVTCTACHEIVAWARYAVWVRMLQQRGEAG